jgi:hypothetical protein
LDSRARQTLTVLRNGFGALCYLAHHRQSALRVDTLRREILKNVRAFSLGVNHALKAVRDSRVSSRHRSILSADGDQENGEAEDCAGQNQSCHESLSGRGRGF